jgi:DnaJ-class molecular chaperone
LFPAFQKEWLDSIPEEWLETTDVSRLEEFASHPQVKLVISMVNSMGKCFPAAQCPVAGAAASSPRKSPVIIQELEVDLQDIYEKKIVKVEMDRHRPSASCDKSIAAAAPLLVPLYFPESIHKGVGDQLSEKHAPGDIIFHVHSKPHPLYQHRREDFFQLSMNVAITPIEAYVGGRRSVQHLSGRDINIHIAPLFFQRMLRAFTLEGFGLWDPTTEAYGDLVIRFSVEYVELDDAKMRLLTETFLPPANEKEEEDWITLQV